jgi:hypothetical protein
MAPAIQGPCSNTVARSVTLSRIAARKILMNMNETTPLATIDIIIPPVTLPTVGQVTLSKPAKNHAAPTRPKTKQAVVLTGTVGGLMTNLGLEVKDAHGRVTADGSFEKTEAYGRAVGKLALLSEQSSAPLVTSRCAESHLRASGHVRATQSWQLLSRGSRGTLHAPSEQRCCSLTATALYL